MTAAVAAALAGGLACTPEGVPNPSGRNTAAKAAPTSRVNPTASPSPNPAAGASASPTPNNGQDITSEVDTSSTPGPTETLAPVTQPTVTPTPLGTLGKAIPVPDGPRFLAFLQNTVRPYVLRLASLASIDNNDQVGQTYTQGIGQPQGIAADGLQDLWVLSAEPPHVDRWKLDLGSLALGVSYSVAASPSAIAAQDGEVWVGSGGGILTRILAATGGHRLVCRLRLPDGDRPGCRRPVGHQFVGRGLQGQPVDRRPDCQVQHWSPPGRRGHRRVGRRLDGRSGRGGGCSTVAGDGVRGYVDGPNSSARFSQNAGWNDGLAVAPNGLIYVADKYNSAIRVIAP